MSLRLFTLLLPLGAVFVWATSGALPAVVASHFSASGEANGFMSRGMYVGIILSLTVFVPLLIAIASLQGSSGSPFAGLGSSARPIGSSGLREAGVHVASVLIVFLCVVHWLVVRSNEVVPRQGIVGSVLVAVLFLLLFGAGFLLALRRPRAPRVP